MKQVTISYDEGASMPDGLGWKVYSFNSRLIGYKHKSDFFAEDIEDGYTELQRETAEKLKDGRAFLLGYQEHGNCLWYIGSKGEPDADDIADADGIMLYDEDECGPMGAESLEDRAKDAAGFLETYTAWCNGECYCYKIEDVTVCQCCKQDVIRPMDEDGCWSGTYYGDDIDYMASEVKEACKGDDVRIVGKAKSLADYHDFGQKAKK